MLGAVAIPLTQGKTALIDAADIELISQYRWWAVRSTIGFYAATKIRTPDGRRRVLQMQRLVMGDPPRNEGEVDHISMDTLDNRRSNLRIATHSQNKANCRRYRTNSSGFKGVYWGPRQRRWTTAIRVAGKLRWLGEFTSPEEAARTYDRAAREAFGEFARCNFPAT